MATPLARLGVMRLGASRLGTFQPWVRVTIAGVDRTAYVNMAGLTVTDALNHEPNTANLRVREDVPAAPQKGQEVKVFLGDTDVAHTLFAGHILTLDQVLLFDDKTDAAYDLACIDYTWLLNRRLVLTQYTSESATNIVRDLMASFTSGFTTVNVEEGLPDIDEITFTNEQMDDALSRIAERIGAHWYIDYGKDLHFFLDEGLTAGSISDDTHDGAMDLEAFDAAAFDAAIGGSLRGMKGIRTSIDLSQAVTRVWSRGGGSTASVDVVPGDTALPIEETTWYAATGGYVDVGPQRLSYTGVRGLTVTGAFVGTGAAPGAAALPTPGAGSSHTVGATYQYAVSFTTAAGETLTGPLGSITIQTLTMVAPPAITARSRGPSYPTGAISPGATTIRFAVQIGYVGGAVGPLGAASTSYAWDGHDWEVYLGLTSPFGSGSYYPLLEPGGPVAPVNYVAIYRSDDGGGWQPVAYTPGLYGGGGGWVGGVAVGYVSPAPGAAPTSSFGAVNLTNIPVSGSASVTGRKIYRTVADGSALKLLTTIANNTATSYGDTTVDGSLGASAPTVDTSGILGQGQVLPGASTLPVSGTTPFSEDVGPAGGGGWVLVGNIPVRYTGIGAAALTGVPASGTGSITAVVNYGTQVLIMPRLTGIPASGVGSVQFNIREGDEVNVAAMAEDAAAQTALAALVGGDGIVEAFISDGRFSETEALTLAEAQLEERKDPLVTVRFDTRDMTAQSGRNVTVTLSDPPVSGTYRIQRVTIREIGIGRNGLAMTFPLRTVEASSRRFSFEDLIRQIRGT